MDERRIHKRYYFKALLQLANAGEYSNVDLEAINISAGGILLRSTHLLDVNQDIILTFSLPGRPNPVQAHCRIIHNLEALPGKKYFIGCQFTRLEGISTEELTAILKEHFDNK